MIHYATINLQFAKRFRTDKPSKTELQLGILDSVSTSYAYESLGLTLGDLLRGGHGLARGRSTSRYL